MVTRSVKEGNDSLSLLPRSCDQEIRHVKGDRFSESLGFILEEMENTANEAGEALDSSAYDYYM